MQEILNRSVGLEDVMPLLKRMRRDAPDGHKMFVFGSVLYGSAIKGESDVDIAIVGPRAREIAKKLQYKYIPEFMDSLGLPPSVHGMDEKTWKMFSKGMRVVEV